MTEYLNMWKNYVNFSARTTRKGYWMAVLIGFAIASILYYLHVQIGYGSGSMMILRLIYSLASLIPGIAIIIRRLRDAGQSWMNIFWLLLSFIAYYVLYPSSVIQSWMDFFWLLLLLISGIVFIVKLCKKSIPDNGVPVV